MPPVGDVADEDDVIKAVSVGPNGPLLILGLSDLNVDRLMAGDPIKFSLSELGWQLAPCQPWEKDGKGDVLIAHGKTEGAIAEALGFPGSEAKPGCKKLVKFDRPLRRIRAERVETKPGDVFVVRIPDGSKCKPATEALEALGRAKQFTFLVVPEGVGLERLTDEALAAAGLRRVET